MWIQIQAIPRIGQEGGRIKGARRRIVNVKKNLLEKDFRKLISPLKPGGQHLTPKLSQLSKEDSSPSVPLLCHSKKSELKQQEAKERELHCRPKCLRYSRLERAWPFS